MKINVGDSVTCVEAVPAFYSRYAGNPACVFRPGMTGTVAHVDVAPVRVNCRSVIVDFKAQVFNKSKHPTDIWRVALRTNNVRKLKRTSTKPNGKP